MSFEGKCIKISLFHLVYTQGAHVKFQHQNIIIGQSFQTVKFRHEYRGDEGEYENSKTWVLFIIWKIGEVFDCFPKCNTV